MKYVEVSYRSGGRVLTKRYPARTVGEPWDNKPDWYCCRGCGHALCSCAPELVAPEPPADVLPEGWKRRSDDDEYYAHVSGAAVARGWRPVWCWWTAAQKGDDEAVCPDPKPTRDAAMAAALASVQTVCVRCGRESPTDVCSDCARTIVKPAEPTLRAGWEVDDDGLYIGFKRVGHLEVFRQKELPGTGHWLILGLSELGYFETAELAMIRAEELARG